MTGAADARWRAVRSDGRTPLPPHVARAHRALVLPAAAESIENDAVRSALEAFRAGRIDLDSLEATILMAGGREEIESTADRDDGLYVRAVLIADTVRRERIAVALGVDPLDVDAVSEATHHLLDGFRWVVGSGARTMVDEGVFAHVPGLSLAAKRGGRWLVAWSPRHDFGDTRIWHSSGDAPSIAFGRHEFFGEAVRAVERAADDWTTDCLEDAGRMRSRSRT